MSEDAAAQADKSKGTAKTVYILYLAGLLLGITAIIGVVMAYINKADAPDWLKTHYQFQIRTFWIGMLYIVISIALSVIFIGIFVYIFWMVWMIIRCVKGLKLLENNESHPNPTGWMF